MSDSAPLEQIEIKLSHLEHAVNELSDTVLLQQREIETLQTRGRVLAERIVLLESGSADKTDRFEMPPHY
jgi:uncharacterized coiled-coil protein SlyX